LLERDCERELPPRDEPEAFERVDALRALVERPRLLLLRLEALRPRAALELREELPLRAAVLLRD
jgi:hypothetical protein